MFEVAAAEDQQPVETSARTVRTKPGVRIACGARIDSG